MVRTRLLALLLPAVPGALLAQWPAYPMPGAPRNPDGKPDLEAPAPRAAGRKT